MKRGRIKEGGERMKKGRGRRNRLVRMNRGERENKQRGEKK